MDPTTQQQVQQMIDQTLKGSFSQKRIGDTPTDAYQLTPKKYVDGKIAGVAPVAVWGDASDASATLDGSSVVGFASIVASNTYNLTRDAYLSSLTVNNGVTLRTNSFRIFAQSLVNNVGTIHNNGYPGGDATVGNAGGAGSVVGAGSLGSSGAGSNGGTPTNAATVSNSWGGAGATGASGGAGGSVVAALTRPVSPTFAALPVDISVGSVFAVRGGSGGGGGKFGSIGNNMGGGGGGGGGLVLIAAKKITNTGAITANGGNGGSGIVDGFGGGGGGGGGVFLFYSSITSGTITVAGGSGGLSPGGPTAPTGASGNIYQFQAFA